MKVAIKNNVETSNLKKLLTSTKQDVIINLVAKKNDERNDL